MLNKRNLFSHLTCWKQGSISCNSQTRLSQWRCFLWDSAWFLLCRLIQKVPSRCCINHHRGWDGGNKSPRPWLNPAITQHARRDVWLDSHNYSHHRSLTAPNNDRLLSSSERRVIRRPACVHLWHFQPWNCRLWWFRDHSCLKCTYQLIEKRFLSQHNSTPRYCDHFQTENLPRNVNCQQTAHTWDWSDMPS